MNFPNLQYVKKLAPIEVEITQERGPFSLFGFFKPEESLPDHWEIVVSAPWIDRADYEKNLRYMVKKVQDRLSSTEMLGFSGIVFIEEHNPGLIELLEDFEVEHGLLRVDHWVFFGQEMRITYLVTAKKANLSKVMVKKAPVS